MFDMSASDQKQAVTMPKYDWYQTDTQVVVTILVKNLKKENVNIDIHDDCLRARLSLTDTGSATDTSSTSDLELTINLAHPVNPDRSTWRLSPSKVEVKLHKRDGLRWSTVERKEAAAAAVSSGTGSDVLSTPLSADGLASGTRDKAEGSSSTNAADGGPAAVAVQQYPSSSKQKKDWDKIEQEVKKEEENEEGEGDAALNKLFQKIYASGSEETKRAMNKSFSESGGTVLSTNWSEVGEKPVDVKPPDGMEYKKYES